MINKTDLIKVQQRVRRNLELLDEANHIAYWLTQVRDTSWPELAKKEFDLCKK